MSPTVLSGKAVGLRTALPFVMLALGLGWAVRGHFGHEWGAAWAGALGAAAVVAASRRTDWARRLPVLVALGALGWGVGGMMSYGLIVGYGRGTDFVNVYYGLAMLGVVGGLYGFIGGGLFGLGLETTQTQRPDWAALLTQMTAGAVLLWGLLIYQLEWFMTPPRSELWAACLGAAGALGWYLHRSGFPRALRVAGFGALGAGFGFTFGNFLQTLGHVSGIAFNWWNVMEFTLGAFGGLGMAYAVWTTRWPQGAAPRRTANALGLLFLLFLLPATNFIQGFDRALFIEHAVERGSTDPDAFATGQLVLAWSVLVGIAVLGGLLWRRWGDDARRLQDRYAPAFFFAYAAFYIFGAHLRKGFLVGGRGAQVEQYLYWGVLGGLALLWGVVLQRAHVPEPDLAVAPPRPPWARFVAAFLLVTALLAAVSIFSHGELPGMQERF